MVNGWHIGLALGALFGPLALPATAQDFPVQRCVNLGNALDAPRFEGEWDYIITQPELDWITAQRFDTVRLPVRFSAHWRDGRIDDWLMGRVDQIIEQAHDRGMTVILDLHHFEEISADPDGETDKFLAIWAELAGHYAGYGDDLVFELLNEPFDQLTTGRVVDLYRQVLPIIRANNPDRWIIAGGGTWSNIATLPDMPDLGDNVAVTFHYYEPYDFTHQSVYWETDPPAPRDWGSADDLTELATNFEIAGAWGQRVGGTLFLGEFGAYERIAPDLRTAWTRSVRQSAEAQGIGWCVWAAQANFAIRDRNTGDWVPGMQDALFGD